MVQELILLLVAGIFIYLIAGYIGVGIAFVLLVIYLIRNT